jgi:hypothetical protein
MLPSCLTPLQAARSRWWIVSGQGARMIAIHLAERASARHDQRSSPRYEEVASRTWSSGSEGAWSWSPCVVSGSNSER